MVGSRLRIDQLGCCGEVVWLPSAALSFCSALSPRGATLLRLERNPVPMSYDARGAQSSLPFSSSSITRFSKRLAPPPSMLR